MGRPSKLTPQVQKTICDALEYGQTYEAAAALAGITSSTVRLWLSKAEGPDPAKDVAAFSAAVQRARGVAERRALDMVWAAGRGWQAGAWFLERSNPAVWGRPWRTQSTDTELPDDPLREMMEEIKRRRGPATMPGKESHVEEVPVGDQDEGDREEGAAPQEGE